MVSKNRKTILNKFYGIKEVSGLDYGEGFYDALDWFDKRIRAFLNDKNLFIEFANYMANKKKMYDIKTRNEDAKDNMYVFQRRDILS